ncbi:hypothetical protein C8Q76DRAFT_627563, partial [Earliella scabrosa]
MRFDAVHPEYERKQLKLLTPCEAYIPVLIGPSAPRHDRSEERARYCRLMCLLFAPWRGVDDIRIDGESWEECYDRLHPSFTNHSRSVISNIDMLNECRDSRDD